MGFIWLWIIGCTTGMIPSQTILQISDRIETIPLFVIGQPIQKAQWRVKPSLKVCASSEVPIYRVAQAVRFWESLGYHFDGITRDYFSMCMSPAYGEIIITLPESGFSDRHMASTTLYTSIDEGYIVKAKINILPKHGRKERVLEHEIGHALGWSHYPKKFHMMHPNWADGGYERKGLRNSEWNTTKQ